MYAPILTFLKDALATRSADLLVGIPNSEIRRNAMHFLTMSMILGAVLIVIRWMHLSGIESLVGEHRAVSVAGGIGLEIVWLTVYLVGLSVIWILKPAGVWVVRLTIVVVLLEGVVVMLRWSLGFDPGPGGNALAGILIVMTMGASLLPWAPRQALGLAAAWVIGATVTLLAVTPGDVVGIGVTVLSYFSVAVPGLMVSFFKTMRVKDRFEIDNLQTRYERINQELAAAKSIHEQAFPQPRTSGSVRFAYSYRPMSLIGGDYLFASFERGNPDSAVLVVLLDVSGHGIPAALTVNRLQGELMQFVGEHPATDPGALLSALNRYICLTCPEAPVLVSGVAVRVDPVADSIQVANAGHPGALLRGKSGNLTRIDATGPLMGIESGAGTMDWGVEKFTFKPGDALVAFTDGLTEASDSGGGMFGISGIEESIRSRWLDPGQRWPELVQRSVDRYCEGVVNDDMLIVDVYRP